jgi:hypothetical protein
MQLARHPGNGRFSERWLCRQMAPNDPERPFAAMAIKPHSRLSITADHARATSLSAPMQN